MPKFIDLVIRGKDLLTGKSDKAAASIGALKTEVKQLDSQLKSIEQTEESVKAFQELSDSSVELSKALDESKGSIKTFAADQAKASDELNKAKSQVKSLELSLSELNKEYKSQSTLLRDNDKKLATSTAKLKEQKAALSQSERAINETNDAYKAQQKIVSDLEAKYKQTKKPINDLNESYKVAKAQLKALENTQKSNAQTLERTKSSYQQTKALVEQLSKTQRDYQASTELTQNALEESNASLVKQKSRLTELNQTLKTADANYTAANKATLSLGKSLEKNNRELDKVTGRLRRAGVNTEDLANETTRLTKSKKELVAQTKKTFNALAKETSKLKGAAASMNKMGNAVREFKRDLLALGAGYLSITTITSALKNFISVGANFETFRLQFNGIMGSVAEGERAFQWVKDFARETPLDMEQTTQAFVMLKGAGLDPMNGSLQALTDATAKYTGGTAKLENITRQLSQAWAKGRITAEDMTNTADNGLPVWNLLAQATGKTVGELRKLSEAGKLGRYELKLLFAELGNDAVGSATRLMSSFNGQVAIAKFNIQEFLDTVAQSGALDALTQKLVAFNAQVKEMAANGELKKFAQEMSDRFVEMVNDTSSAAKAVFENLKGFTDAVTTSFNAASVVINVFTGTVRQSLGIAFKVISLLAHQVERLTSLFGALPNAISKGVGEFRKLANEMSKEAVKQAGKDFDQLTEALDSFNEKANSTSGAAKKVTEEVGNIKKAVEPLGGALEASGQKALVMANDILASADKLKEAELPMDRLKETVSVLIAKLKDDPSPVVQQTVDRLKVLFNSMASDVKQSGNQVTKTLEDVEREFENLGGTTLNRLQENVTKSVELFNRFKEAGKPISELRQAFLQQLDAQVALAKATGKSLSATLSVTAAQLGLKDSFEQSSEAVDRHNATMNGTVDVYDRIVKKQKELRSVGTDSSKITRKQAEAQKELNEANAAAASRAGANLAFQKLWNEAHAYSIKLYDYGSQSLESLRARTKELGDEIFKINFRSSWSTILRPINSLYEAGVRNELKAIDQAKAYQRLFQKIEGGYASIGELNYYARNASELFDRLGDSDLSRLQAQIERAREALNHLKDDLTDTVHSLKNELDQLEGNQSNVLARDYQAEKLELEAKLKEAEKSNDRDAISDAKEALQLAQKIYQIRSKKIKDESIQTTKEVKETVKTENKNTSNVREVRNVQEIRHTVTFVAGRASTSFTTNDSSVAKLLEELERSGLRVTKG